MDLEKLELFELPKVHDPRGNLSYVQSGIHIDFDIKRVFYLYDVPGGESRAGHALKKCHQVIIAMSGSFDVHLDNGRKRRTFTLNRSYYGIHIYPRVWRILDNFSSGAVCVVLASESYDPADYFRDYDVFRNEILGSAE